MCWSLLILLFGTFIYYFLVQDINHDIYCVTWLNEPKSSSWGRLCACHQQVAVCWECCFSVAFREESKVISKLRRHHVCMNTDWCFFIRNTQMPLKFSPPEISGLSITEKTHTSGYFETTMQISSVTWNSYVFTITWSIPNQNTGVYSCYSFIQKQWIYFCNLFYWE